MNETILPAEPRAIAPAGAAGAGPLAPVLARAQALAQQPAVRRSLPLLMLAGLVAAALLAWAMLSTPAQRILFASLADADKAAITTALDAANIRSRIDAAGSITVAEDDYHKARMLLAGQGLPKAAPGGYQILDQLPMGVSRAVEGERLRQARETELARSIQEIDAIAEARVHLATPEASAFVRDRAQPSASVIVRLHPGRVLGEAQIRAIVNLVASSVPGMQPEAVTIVDQAGALLSRPGGGSAGDARIEAQRRVEDKLRTQLAQLLTPMVGAGNFTAEVQAELDLDENQATRESYDKQGVVRAEQGNWSAAPREGPAGGIPGALSNTPPPAAALTAPNAPNAPQGGKPGAANGPAAAAAAAPGAAAPAPGMAKESDSFARSYETGKQVSVTRATPGAVKRLSVAVLLREEPGKPRSLAEINQINELVRAAVGYDAARQDQVTVVSRKFSTAANGDAGPAWYEAEWVPMAARNATAIVIALLVLLLGVRPALRAIGRRRDAAAGVPTPDGALAGVPMAAAGGDVATGGAAIPAPADPAARIGMVRALTRDDPARAALAVRDMIRSDAA